MRIQQLVLRVALVTLFVIPLMAQKPPRFRVISYNVLVGFQDHKVGAPYLRGTERKEKVASWLAEQKPHVVAFQEMNGYTEAKLRTEANGWGHPYAVILKESGYPTALTSRRPIVVLERRLEGMHHGVMVCRTCGIDFVVVHLCPFKGDEKRLQEIEVVLELCKRSRDAGQSVVLLGDFNAVSSVDVERFSDAARARYRRWGRDLKNGKPTTQVIQPVLDADFVDIHAKHRDAAAELPLPRIDFLFASPDLASKSTASQWITDTEALKNSDHPAVVADFDLELPRFPSYPEQDALAYTLDLFVDPAGKQLKGEVDYRFRAVSPLDRVFLDARQGDTWTVKFLSRGREPLEARWVKDRVVVMLPNRVAAGEEIRFKASIEGLPPDGFYFKKSRYGDPLAFTDHYSIRARGWLPCEDHPGDRALFRIDLRWPNGYAAVASGVPVKANLPAARGPRLAHVTHSDIPPYMLAICVGPYERVAEEGGERLWPHFVYKKDVERAKPMLVHHAMWLKEMENAFGPYPYGKYTTIQCPTRWGGFEAPGNVLLSESLFDQPGPGTGTLAHELVHMWFGDGVGYAEWHEVWLSEGFASYFGPWLHAKAGGPTLKKSLAFMRERWKRSIDGRRKSVRWDGFGHPDRALNANTYPKGAWVLHMLRGELGDERFFAVLRAFFEKYRGTSVVTHDFVKTIEESTGTDLDWFFDQWLNRVGCPLLSVKPGPDGIVVEQGQREPYRFRLTLAWTDSKGERAQRTFQIESVRTVLDVKNARDIVIDPDTELLFR